MARHIFKHLETNDETARQVGASAWLPELAKEKSRSPMSHLIGALIGNHIGYCVETIGLRLHLLRERAITPFPQLRC
jgi:hypothetical protein